MRKIILLAFVALIVTIGARSSFTSNTTSPASPFCTVDPVVSNNLDSGAGSLRDVIADACAGSTITFNMATVTSPITLTGGELLINKNLIINGPGANALTVQRSNAGGTPDFRIFNINGGVTVALSGLTLTNGRISGTFPGNFGGAIWNNHSHLTITDCVITANSAVAVAPAGFGGAIFNDGADFGSASLAIVNTQITGNSATGNGGGIFSWGSHGNATLTITGSTISNNSAQSGGGGIANSGQSGSASVRIVNSLLSGNTAQSGGGINSEGTQNGNAPLTIANSTISGNGATAIGGGIVIQGTTNTSGAPVTIVNTTITNNRVDIDDTAPGNQNGGGMFIFTGPVTIHNTIVARNFVGSTGTLPDDVFNNSFQPNSSFNLIGIGGSGGLVNDVNGNIVHADPHLGPLADNGGPTQTHALLPGSRAIEGGSNCPLDDSCSPALGFSLATDQRGAGFQRAADSSDLNTTQTVDIGAFEMHASVEDMVDQTIPEDGLLVVLFTVGDAAAITSVTATSSNTLLFPNDPARLEVTGSGPFRAVVGTPLQNQFGTTLITVTVTSGSESVTDTFLVTVTPVNDAPHEVLLSNMNVNDNSPAGTLVGTLTAIDPDPLQTFTYSLVSGRNSIDNASFTISGDQLRTTSVFDFETKTTYLIRLRATDPTNLHVEKEFIINVVDGPDIPGAISFTSPTFSVGEADGNASITLKRTGGTDNRVFAKVSLADVTTSPADYRFAPGSLDPTFNTGTGATSGSSALSQVVHAVAVQPDGKVLIGGAFLFYDGIPRKRMARLNPDGTLDHSFNPSFEDIVLSIALQPDGKILVGGDFMALSFETGRNRIARLNPDGSLDQTFNPNTPNDSVTAIAVQPDGKILLGGAFTNLDGFPRKGVARLNVAGDLDDIFFDPGVGANAGVTTLVLQPDGKILVGGGFTSFGSASDTRLVRLNNNGTVDGTFNSALGLSLAPRQVVLQPDGKILVGGEWVGTDTPFGHRGIARLESNGVSDATFNPGTGTNGQTVDALALQPDSRIVIVGRFPGFNGTTVNGVARLNSSGLPDTSFNSGGGVNLPFPAFEVVVQPDGKILLGGQFTSYDGVSRNGITRINGDLFVSWAPGDSANKTVLLPIVNDALDEPNETLSLQVTPLSVGATAGTPATSTLTIVDNDPSPTTISSVSGVGIFGGTATLMATLTSNGANLSGKSITFTRNGTTVGSATTAANGIATLTGVSLAGINSGIYDSAIGAAFTGDGVDFASSNGTGPLTVTKATSTTVVTSSVNPSDLGQMVTFTATVTSAGGTPTGTVQFRNNGGQFGAPEPLIAGVAKISTLVLSPGTHAITADYSGDTNFIVSSGTLAGGQLVKAPSITIGDVSIIEPNAFATNVVLEVTLSAASAVTVSVNYATADDTATTADNDYFATSGTLHFNPGETSKTISVAIIGDQKFEMNESLFVNLTNPVNAIVGDGQAVITVLNTDDLRLFLDESGPATNQVAAVDSFLLVRDPFHVQSIADWLPNLGPDRNTRVTIFAQHLEWLDPIFLPSSAVVSLVDANGQAHEVTAEAVRPLPGVNAVAQITFRLPDNLAPGVCSVTLKTQGRISNTGSMRIAP